MFQFDWYFSDGLRNHKLVGVFLQRFRFSFPHSGKKNPTSWKAPEEVQSLCLQLAQLAITGHLGQKTHQKWVDGSCGRPPVTFTTKKMTLSVGDGCLEISFATGHKGFRIPRSKVVYHDHGLNATKSRVCWPWFPPNGWLWIYIYIYKISLFSSDFVWHVEHPWTQACHDCHRPSVSIHFMTWTAPPFWINRKNQRIRTRIRLIGLLSGLITIPGKYSVSHLNSTTTSNSWKERKSGVLFTKPKAKDDQH